MQPITYNVYRLTLRSVIQKIGYDVPVPSPSGPGTPTLDPHTNPPPPAPSPIFTGRFERSDTHSK